MKKFFPRIKARRLTHNLILISLFIAGLIYSCKKDITTTSTTPLDNSAQTAVVKEAKAWFERNAEINKKSPQAANALNDRNWNEGINLDWNKPDVYSKNKGALVELPLFNSSVVFAFDRTNASGITQKNNYTKTSFIVQKDSAGVFRGWYMVLIADTAYINGNFARLNLNTYKSHDKDFSGRLLYYTPQGEFLAGWRYQKGIITKTLSVTPGVSSTNLKQVNSKQEINLAQFCYSHPVVTTTASCFTDPNTGMYDCTYTYTTTNITECYDLPSGGSGGGGSSGGGGTFPPPPPTTPCPTIGVSSINGQHVNTLPGGGDDGCPTDPKINIPSKGPKVDPKKENKCFDKSKAAKMTIYVQQPNPNTRDMMGANSVGHTFVGITQGGITRSFGFYPDSPMAAVLGSQDSELHDNSGELYHVSISKDITSAQLTNVLNYINNYPSTYTLSNYNCTDFAIAVAAQGGLNLPSTTGNTNQMGFNFSGRNPGDLGQDIRNMQLPQGTVRSQGSQNAPNKSGTCP